MEVSPTATMILCLHKLPKQIPMTRGWILAQELQCMVKVLIQMRWIQITMYLLVLKQQATWLHLHSHTTTTTINRDSHLSSQAVVSTNPLTRSIATTIPITIITIIITNLKLTWLHPKSLTWPTLIISIQVRWMVLGSLKLHPIIQRKDLQVSEAQWEVEFQVELRHSNRALRISRRCWSLLKISCRNRILYSIKIIHKKEEREVMLASWKSWASRTKVEMLLLIILWLCINQGLLSMLVDMVDQLVTSQTIWA